MSLIPALQVPTIVVPQDVRDWLDLNTPASQSSYSDATISSNIIGSVAYLEHKTGRFLADRTNVTWVIPGATMIRAQVAIPGFRTFTSVTWGGSTLSVGFTAGTSASCWAIPDQLNSIYVALQFRAWRADSDRPWWLADQRWWDKALDSPFYPGNWGGGYAWTSMPDDLVIEGDVGYPAGLEPYDVRMAVRALAGFETFRPRSILSDVSITPAGGILNYSRLPNEVVEFLADYKLGGDQAVSM